MADPTPVLTADAVIVVFAAHGIDSAAKLDSVLSDLSRYLAERTRRELANEPEPVTLHDFGNPPAWARHC